MIRQTRPNGPGKNVFSSGPVVSFNFESLESRRLLSHGGFGCGGGGGDDGGGDGQNPGSTIEFSQAPSVVQAGLDALAKTDSVTAPTSTQTVILGNSNGVETYTIDITGVGTDTRLTVDVDGNPVTAPTQTTTTFGAITNTAVTDEITLIASALNLTAPTSTTSVQISTPVTGPATYTIFLDDMSDGGGRAITVDADGNPVGQESVPFSVLPATIQNALIKNEPTGVTLTASSTQSVHIRTIDGVVTYTMAFNTTGTTTKVTVNESGDLVSLPTRTKTVFSDLPTVAQTELQTLATADGVSTTISSTQTVIEYTETNGTIVYSVTLADDTSTLQSVTITVDANGNPTVPPDGDSGGDGGGFTGSFFGGSGFSMGFGFDRHGGFGGFGL